MPETLAIVTWLDSMLVDRYVPEEDLALKLTELTTVGFVVKDDPEFLVLAREQHNGVYRGLVVIPKFAITSRKPLRQR